MELAEATGSHELEVRALLWRGSALSTAGQFEQALRLYERAAARAEEGGFPLDTIDALSGAAAATLDSGRLDQVRAHAERAAALLGQIDADLLYRGQLVAWQLYRVFHALGDRRAEAFQKQARDIMQRRAASIADPDERRAFLQNPINRAIAEGMSKVPRPRSKAKRRAS